MRLAAVSVAILTLCACGGGGAPTTPTPPPKTPVSVAVGPLAANVIHIGDDQAYTATVHWSDGTDSAETASWSSDNSSVATIDSGGKAHGAGSGEATLIATTQQHGTGTLKIRVVPNYQGTWTGDYTVRGCNATGAFPPSDWCSRDAFQPGNILPIILAFTQNTDKVSGTITFGQVPTNVDATSSIAIDGALNLTAQGTFTGSDSSQTLLTINPASFRANGPNMTGSFTLTFTANGYPGSAAIASDLNSVPRTSTLTGVNFAIPPRFSSVLDLMRGFRQK
jgi:hypothetical protein